MTSSIPGRGMIIDELREVLMEFIFLPLDVRVALLAEEALPPDRCKAVAELIQRTLLKRLHPLVSLLWALGDEQVEGLHRAMLAGGSELREALDSWSAGEVMSDQVIALVSRRHAACAEALKAYVAARCGEAEALELGELPEG
jgi:hypothetical protein